MTLLLVLSPFAVQPRPAQAADAAISKPALPDEILIKTPTQTFNSRFQYALVDGRIWIKPVLPKSPPGVTPTMPPMDPKDAYLKPGWQLMSCAGLPCEPGNPGFHVPQAIREISADADELTAIDDTGRFYFRTMAGPGLMSTTEWTDLSGFPKAPLQLPDMLQHKRGWSMGRRHFDVLWHEDADGNPHHVGTMGTSTVYVLSPGGNDIWYTDNGLPADLSHNVCGPQRGTVVMQNLQASASMLFAIDARGQTWTHMNDFDLNGGTSMFLYYSYTPQKHSADPPGSDFKSNLTPWRLPLQDWQAQPKVTLTGKARLSREITILQTGQGNAARELRIAGLNAQGQTGYYAKAVFDPGWHFQPAPLQIPAADWLNPADPLTAPVQDIHYYGKIGFGGEEVYQAELLNYNLRCSPATLRLNLPDGPLDLILHTVDGWNHALRPDPDTDNTVRFKLGTLEIPAAQLARTPARIKALNQSTFALPMAAERGQVFVFNARGEFLGNFNSAPGTFALTPPAGPMVGARLAKNGPEESWAVLLKYPELLQDDLSGFTIPQLQELIKANQALLDKTQKEYELMGAARLQTWMETMGTVLVRNFYVSFGLCWWMPSGQAFCRSAPELMLATYGMEYYLSDQRQFLAEQIKHLLSFTLDRYKARLLELQVAEANKAARP